MTTVKSAIRECRDQLFLDRAVDRYLTHVASNLGFTRPVIGFNDDSLWRAVVRRIALHYRQVICLFHDLLTIIFGPRHTVSTTLAEDVAVGDEEIWITDWMNIPQRGILILDEGLATEETIEYAFRDPRNGLVSLRSACTLAHTAYGEEAESYLTVDYAPAVTTLVLEETALFPVPAGGTLFTMIIDPGKSTEEVIILNGNTTATKTLTIVAPGLVNAHSGPRTTPTISHLTRIEGGGNVITLASTANFPAIGLVRVQQDVLAGTPSQTVRYVENDVDNGILTLADKLTGSYVLTPPDYVTVTLMEPGAAVRMAQVQVKGVGWEVFQTRPAMVQIYLPLTLTRNRLLDASFLHSTIQASVGLTVATGGATLGDTVLHCDPTDPNLRVIPRSGIVVINAGNPTEEYVGFVIPDYDYTEMTVAQIGSTEIFVDDARLIQQYEFMNPDKWISLSTNNIGRYERLQYTDIDLSTNKITLSTVTTKLHSSGDIASSPNGGSYLYLSRGLTYNHVAAETVDYYQIAWAGTDLEDGRMSHGSKKFFGHYVYDIREYYPRTIQTTLNEDVAGPTLLKVTQHPGRNGIEIENGTLLEATGVYDIKLRRGGDEEILDVSKVVTKPVFAALGVQTNAAATIGESALTVVNMPTWPGTDIGVRLIVDPGGGNEEIVVLKEAVSPTQITLELPLASNHVGGEDILLLSDAVIFSEALTIEHKGSIAWTQRTTRYPGPFNKSSSICIVEEIRTKVDVASVVSFPLTSSSVLINFGANKITVDSRVAATIAAGTGAVTIEDSSQFPTTGYPYYVELGVDCDVFETLLVTANVANVLTFSTNTHNAHLKGEWVRYRPGVAERITYDSTITGGLIFDSGVIFADSHLKGEVVSLDSLISKPSRYGNDYPVYLPATWADKLKFLFDLGRAAGVQIVTINSK